MKSSTLHSSAAGDGMLKTDVLIAGCGAAGLYAALNLPPALHCLIISKGSSEVSNSVYAQGGISAVIARDVHLREGHVEDTLAAGAGLCDKAAVETLVNEAAENIERLLALDVPFDRRCGKLLCTREGGHKEQRILHCGGDATGMHLTQTLLRQAKARENIRFLDHTMLTEILTDGQGVCGIAALTRGGKPLVIQAGRLILATGGIGQAYLSTTNARCATGDGMAAALRAGIKLKNMEFVQFHPTVLYSPNPEERSFLISEALRGEGARLMNRSGGYFMQGQHPMADLAPRDIVARAIFREMEKSGDPCVYLDITQHTRSFLEQRFPTVFSECMARGIDISQDPIPVHPVQHYMMGGIETGLYAQTALPGLYACGETACTGVHGANRLASNSLLECIVFSRRAALHAADACLPSAAPRPLRHAQTAGLENGGTVKRQIQDMMSTHCGIVRSAQGLSLAERGLGALLDTLQGCALSTISQIELLNMAQVALSIVAAAQLRGQSLGAHYRKDSKGD